MLLKREKPLPVEQNPVEAEKTPEYFGETSQMIETIDAHIEYSQNLLNGLDRLVQEKIIVDQGIDPYKEIGRVDLEAKYGDAKVLEEADNRSRLRNVWRRLTSNKYLKSETGLVDTRKLKQGIEGRMDVLSPEELLGAAKLFGLNPNNRDLAKIYTRGEKGEGADKVILQRKTEQEIMEQWLKELENGQSAKLTIESKEGLAELIKEKEKLDKEEQLYGLNEADLAKIENEETAIKELIKQNQKNLDSELDIFRQPLLEHQQDIASSLSDLSFLLEEITGQEKDYERKISGLETKINKFKGSKRIGELLKDEIKDWEEQKAQTQANLKDFEEKKGALNLRITELKTSQAEVDAALARINNIGKTEAEKTEEKKQQREEQRREREYQREQRELARQQRPDDIVRQSNRLDIGKNEEETAQAAGQSAQASAPAGKSSGKNQPPEKPAGPKLKNENNPPAGTAETERENKENVVGRVSQWLDLLGLNNAPETAETAIENNFKVGRNFNLTNTMTLGQARQNYTQYLIDFLKIPIVRAQRQAQVKFEEIIKNLPV